MTGDPTLIQNLLNHCASLFPKSFGSFLKPVCSILAANAQAQREGNDNVST
jgi:hypothetical protein